jgi:hypothetical protein
MEELKFDRGVDDVNLRASGAIVWQVNERLVARCFAKPSFVVLGF